MTDASVNTSPDDSNSTAAQPSWGFWASIGWVVVAIFGSSIPVGLTLAVWVRASRQFGSNQTFLSSHVVSAAISYVPAIIALYFIARILSPSGLKYLGLQWPKIRYLLLGILCGLLYVLIVFGLIIAIFGGLVTRDVIELYRSAVNTHALPLLWICIVLIVPLGEEIVFRGFLYRGWSESRLGAPGAIVLTSFAWLLMHLPNNLIFLSTAFVCGLMLGWLRWLSGSVLTPFLMHVLTNTVVMLHASNAVSH